jgi:hypothetical protein
MWPKVLQHVKKSLYNQPKPYFFKKLLWSHFWINFNQFYTKTLRIVYILIVLFAHYVIWVLGTGSFRPNPVPPLSRFAPIPVRPGSFRLPYSHSPWVVSPRFINKSQKLTILFKLWTNKNHSKSKLRNRLGLAKAGKLVFCYRMLRGGKEEIDWWTLKLYGWTEKCRYKIVVTVLTCF